MLSRVQRRRSSWPANDLARHTVAVATSHNVLTGLSRSYLFDDLDVSELELLAAAATVRSFAGGESVWAVGDPAEETYVVLDGEVKDTVMDIDGNELVQPPPARAGGFEPTASGRTAGDTEGVAIDAISDDRCESRERQPGTREPRRCGLRAL